MTLSIVGRYQLLFGGSFYCMVQDPDDTDSFYGVVFGGSTLQLYKFTWPDQMVHLVDTGITLPTGYGLYNGVLAQDIQYGVGLVDETWHYAFCRMGVNTPPYPTGTLIVDVNLSTLEITTYEDLTISATPYGDMVWTFDGVGSYFCVAAGAHIIKKRYGQSLGSTTSVADAGTPWLIIDDQSWATFKTGSPNKWNRVYTQGTPSVGLLGTGATYLPEPTSFDPGATVMNMGRTTPGNMVMWDDEWRYMLWRLGVGSESWLCAVRKHIGSGTYSFAVVSTDHNGEEGQVNNAFDIWQTGDTGSAGAVRKVFFTHGGHRNKVFSSLAWPITVDNSIVLDDGPEAAFTTLFVATSGEYVYVHHTGGTTYGSCITKIKDADLIVEPDVSPSISATGAKVIWKDKRVFFIKVPGYGRHLWWGAPFEPQSLDPSWDGYNTPVFENEDNTALQVYGDMVYIGSRAGWKRLRGKTPDYWVLDDLESVVGPTTDKTVAVTPFGAIYPREDGLYLFNGYSTRLFYPQAKLIMKNINWNAIDKAFSLWDGRYFHLFYPSGSAVVNDRELIVDLIGGLENARATESTRGASAGFYDPITKILFLGDEDGNLLVPGSSGSRSLEVVTKEFAANQLIRAGTFQKLHYEADTLGEDLIVTPYYDGVEQSQRTINTTGRRRGFVTLPKGNAYRVGIKISITTDKDIRIYEPWVLE